MPPFLTVLGALYILPGALYLIGFVKAGYWSGVLGEISNIIRKNLLWVICAVIIDLLIIKFLDLPFTLYLIALDKVIHSYTFWDFICSCAEGGFVGGVLFTLFMLSEHFHWSKLGEVSKISLMSSIFGGLSNGVLKFIFNRQRPSIGLDQWHFFAFFKSGGSHLGDLMYAFNSMPSGHTITTLSAVVPFYLAYKNKLVRLLLILWAFMVNFSRVYTINHWLSDVFMASVLGIIIGFAVYQVNKKRIVEC